MSLLSAIRRYLRGSADAVPRALQEPAAGMRRVFTEIYQTNYWKNKDSRSGAGSDLRQTEVVRRELPRLIERYGIRSMLDLPCGDFFWMQRVELDLDYIGADVVPEMIAKTQRRYGGKRRRFMQLDVTKDDLPRVDLIFSRDLLVHFSFADIDAALANMRRSGSEYLLTTTFTRRPSNIDIRTGHWRTLNFVRPPFEFPEPLALIDEECSEGDGSWDDKSLGLWRLADLPIGSGSSS